MEYTVKKLADITGVSVRTLHWYDKIGLLKPAYYGSNGYRYYKEEQLFLLQRILFFRELGFDLSDTQKLLEQGDLDLIEALSMHKQTLKDNIDRMKKLVDMIDKTILPLKSGKKNIAKDKSCGVVEKFKQREYE